MTKHGVNGSTARSRVHRARASRATGTASRRVPSRSAKAIGARVTVFKDYGTKKGRIEKAGDGEVIRWTSDHCYQILVTPNVLHRGMTRCVAPLDKKGPRGDLFKHMKEAPPPPDRATDVP